ncbi:alpha/beta fold hydrolase [Rugosimonospora africana]|uniref:Putative hydrolase YraK n=1 Tax=Rugosimonospora africana TaxID=556532 RepID=A0A8J3QY93_9ACTN|nr:alpha/beta hydrolase [Rugosimonospora africana]GIH17990.1 putative hydrolase YraK [Rugosimonospora africana]
MVNGARLHYELRGTGPALAFVPGGLVDSAHYAEVAGLLADAFTVLTYDRRGNAGSPRPTGWHSTDLGEQADDLAGLIESLGLAPCAIWGGSLGGLVLLELLARRPGLVRAAIVHEPPLFSVLDIGDRIAGQLATLAAAAVRDDRVDSAVRQHAHETLGDVFERLTPQLRERMTANGRVFFDLEVPGLVRSLPTADAVTAVLDRTDIPVAFMAGPENIQSPPYRITRWLADRVGVELREVPGGHMPYAVDATATAAAIRDVLTA